MARVIIAKLKKIQYWLAGAAIAMVLVGAVYSHAQRLPWKGKVNSEKTLVTWMLMISVEIAKSKKKK
jgi:hypothetical protein